MSPRERDFFIEDFEVKKVSRALATDPKQRIQFFELTIHGRGWVVAASSILVSVGDLQAAPLSVSHDGSELVSALFELPQDGDRVVVRQWDRVAEAPRRFRRRDVRGIRKPPRKTGGS